MKLIIEDDEGRKTVVPVVREEITIGRQDGNTIRLTERNVSRRHARFYRENGSLMLEDLGSYNGVRVNGDRIGEATKVKEGDLIEIGDYDLGIQGKLEPMAGAPAPSKSPKTSGENAKAPKKETPPPAASVAPAPVAKPEPRPEPVAAAPAPAPEPAAAPAPSSPPAAGATAIIRLSDLAKASSGPAEIRDLAKNEMPRLVGLNGSFRAREFYLQKTEVKIGRTDDNDIGIDHQSISRQHCKFTLEDGAWKVYDNKSANGVRLNGDDYAVSAIKPGDTVELGHVKFRFCAPGERFTPPPEKEEKAAAAEKAPVAAPLRSSHAEPATAPIATSNRKGTASKTPLIAGIVGAVVVLAAVGFFAFGRGGGSGKDSGDGSNMSAEEAVKQGDTHFAQHDYIEAVKLYEVAASKGTQPKNLKKAKEESGSQLAYRDLNKAIDSGDFDKAKQQLDTLNADPDRQWAKQAQAKADAVKIGFVKLHLGKATAAKAADPDGCATEAGLALQADPSNEEAQKVAQSCRGGGVKQASTAPDRPRPEKAAAPAGPSQDERNSQASKLVGEGNGLYAARDFDGAIEKFQSALALKPKGSPLGLAYRGLGTAYTQKADKGNIVKYFTAYLPFAAPAEASKVKAIIAYYSK